MHWHLLKESAGRMVKGEGEPTLRKETIPPATVYVCVDLDKVSEKRSGGNTIFCKRMPNRVQRKNLTKRT